MKSKKATKKTVSAKPKKVNAKPNAGKKQKAKIETVIAEKLDPITAEKIRKAEIRKAKIAQSRELMRHISFDESKTFINAVQVEKPAKVKSILITQAKPENDKNPYFSLAERYKINIDFKPFIHLEGIESRDFRRLKINPHDYQAIIFTSRGMVDQFFKLMDELRIKLSENMRYYCMTEAIALYLQKYILFRKRKVFFGDGTFKRFIQELLHHRESESYLIPCSDNHKPDLPEFLTKSKFSFSEAVIFNTVPAQLSEKEIFKYDMIIFFSPSGVHSLLHNFKNISAKKLRFGTFGPVTTQAMLDNNLKLDLVAPVTEAPSMTMALELYLKKSNF